MLYTRCNWNNHDAGLKVADLYEMELQQSQYMA